jgi:hypothetical protein
VRGLKGVTTNKEDIVEAELLLAAKDYQVSTVTTVVPILASVFVCLQIDYISQFQVE